MSPDQQRAAAGFLEKTFAVSERRAGRVLGRSRSTLRHRRRRPAGEPPLVREIQRLARRHPRFGYRRTHAMLVRKGWSTNLKRVRRLWGELGLKPPVRPRKSRRTGPEPGVGGNGCKARPAGFKNDAWTCDFVHDRTAEGRPLKWLSLVDEYTRECLVLHADARLGGADVRRILGRMVGRPGAPNMIRSDDGSEFVCKALADWLPRIATEPIPVAPGSPWQNGFVESFHGRLRDEFLERHEFESAADARAKASWFRREYNHVRPHGSLGCATPSEYAARCESESGKEKAESKELIMLKP